MLNGASNSPLPLRSLALSQLTYSEAWSISHPPTQEKQPPTSEIQPPIDHLLSPIPVSACHKLPPKSQPIPTRSPVRTPTSNTKAPSASPAQAAKTPPPLHTLPSIPSSTLSLSPRLPDHNPPCTSPARLFTERTSTCKTFARKPSQP